MTRSRIERLAPVLPVRSVRAALAHYAKLGFHADAYAETSDGDPIYGFLARDGIELHLARVPELDPRSNTSACYLYVSDANALHAEWSLSGAAGRFTEPENTPYRLREFAHVDPDGNLLRVGSELAQDPSSKTKGAQ
jgi:catechol 2,3-dioxygenase-like lactoylglutathione lyase family enzyme